MSIFPIELPPGEYAATLYAKTDKEDRINILATTVAVK